MIIYNNSSLTFGFLREYLCGTREVGLGLVIVLEEPVLEVFGHAFG